MTVSNYDEDWWRTPMLPVMDNAGNRIKCVSMPVCELSAWSIEGGGLDDICGDPDEATVHLHSRIPVAEDPPRIVKYDDVDESLLIRCRLSKEVMLQMSVMKRIRAFNNMINRDTWRRNRGEGANTVYILYADCTHSDGRTNRSLIDLSTAATSNDADNE
jgi:hypothetical protein